ncbi:MAG: NAD-glutamate dehydrogenase [Rhodospirillaceae bacterium]|nr:NAD-glutamate dehydrogenase [Rhodospirillaceae bacterium]
MAKACFFSTVHRHALTEVVIGKLSAHGKVEGCYLLVGLLTAQAYLSSLKDVPIVRKKLAKSLNALLSLFLAITPNRSAIFWKHIRAMRVFQVDEKAYL